jgi:hypothetical protein
MLWDTVHLLALAVTLVVEGAVMAGYCLRRRLSATVTVHNVALALIVNLATHTLFWAVLPIAPWSGALRLLILESLVTAAEAAWYWVFCRFDPRAALAVSLVCNFASFAAGNLLWSSGLVFQ